MKPVTQEDPFGCAISCVAFICDKSYDYVKNNYFINSEDAKTIGYYCKDIVNAFLMVNKKYNYKYLKKRTNFDIGTIVFIKRSKKYPVGHYLVKTKNGWMDSWINFDINNINLKKAKSGFRKKLPGTPQWIIFPKEND